jgi:DNA-binding GntR family transcriptional regulator
MANEPSLILAPARKRVLADEVVEELRSAILDGRLVPEQPILEARIADMMQVSRGPVREALARLEQEGLVFKVRNRGTFVARLSPEDVDEVHSLRRGLELLAVEYFVRNATPGDLADLEAVLERDGEPPEDDFTPKQAADLDIRFHETFMRACAHRRLCETWLNLREQVRVVLLSRYLANQDYRTIFLPHHRAFLNALRARDIERARAALDEHLTDTYRRLRPDPAVVR